MRLTALLVIVLSVAGCGGYPAGTKIVSPWESKVEDGEDGRAVQVRTVRMYGEFHSQLDEYNCFIEWSSTMAQFVHSESASECYADSTETSWTLDEQE